MSVLSQVCIHTTSWSEVDSSERETDTLGVIPLLYNQLAPQNLAHVQLSRWKNNYPIVSLQAQMSCRLKRLTLLSGTRWVRH